MEEIRKAYIIRGIPGSGKNTKAKELIKCGGIIHSAMDFVTKNQTGDVSTHIGRKKKNRLRILNFHYFCLSLDMRIPVVVCVGTFLRRRDCLPYEIAAKTHGYWVAVINMPLPSVEMAIRRSHGIPAEALERMRLVWEP